MNRNFEGMTIGNLLEDRPYVESWLVENGLAEDIDSGSVLTQHLDADRLEALGGFITEMDAFLCGDEEAVETISVFGGRDKDGRPEPVSELTVGMGQVVCIVGPTGSGKSRLLADIEWVAQGDTPTGRRVQINGETPESKWRLSSEHKLVAQLSQNMNFVMDMSVEEFLTLHAESRHADDPQQKILRIHEEANALAGEPFDLATPITSLSGGQSRALMIADTAVLSRSPVVLIDEIENAGIDRRRALDVLVREDKIVLMATHDPILALMGDLRVVINNGAMVDLIRPNAAEKANLGELRRLDAKLMELRRRLRGGERLDRI